MDPDPPSSSPRKMKFAPKAPPRRKPKPATTAIAEDDDVETQRALFRRLNEQQTRRGPKVEKKSPVEVAFSHGVASTDDRSERANIGRERERTDDQRKNVTTLSTAGTGVGKSSGDLTNDAIPKKKREYQDPWDHNTSYCPITLPLRSPNSGDPELLDEAEFVETPEYDENSLSSASDLGLLEQDDKPRMLFFKFPSKFPLGRGPTSAIRRDADDNSKATEKSVINQKGKGIAGSVSSVSGTPTDTKGKEIAGNSIDETSGNPSRRECNLEELAEGYMGKMVVYKNGAVKLKLGDILYDVSPGSECSFPQSVMAINTTNRECCELGEVKKRVLVTPDIDSLLLNGID